VSCNDVYFTGTHRKTKQTSHLQGETWHTIGADDVTPSRSLGYKCRSGDVVYYIDEAGNLDAVRNGTHSLFSENGVWQ